MNVFTRSRSSKAISGIAVVGISALFLAGCSSTGDGGSSSAPEAGEEMTLKIGTALPQTGNLAFLGPPEEAGVAYAASQVNEVSADTGLSMDVVYGDSGDTDNKAYETEIPRLLNEDVSAIIGAASSGVSLQFIDQVTGAGVIQFSPANTSDAFTTYDDNGLYFRTAPSDVLQGEVLGNLIAEDGNQTLGMIVLNDSYGTGLAKYVTDAFEAAGGEVVASTTYNTGDTTFDAQVSEVLAADPDAIALITFEEVTTILPSLFGQFPSDKLYFVDGNLSNFGDEFPEGSLTGAKGTLPGLSIDSIGDFTGALDEFVASEGEDPLEEYSYAAESFDSVILLALASLAAGSTDSDAIAEKLIEVSGGSGDGEKCTTYSDCADIILGGGTADYDGVSGPITFDDVGDPTEASVGIYQFGYDNNYSAYEG
ncbi:branched-chain amino acid transport system substrate-binding protein [Microbacterium endophyticum]|uniref:Branched-chain amino acid transport system substrate-binding protein n=1 Tax=Microbacterium endophyticum TaxID=1526412 RepID=A0A7W4V2Q6_9MICO|nr:ABC transporter substrate-binding protein [Microbacterium endophyticum]MBB2975614.1 branched-chain amino acid transport system substrate-binding protein [Microbacterium endophyticum]NIK35367.1 branched-chain amino acid transport system substrate-binding protein [Microbacterium endophyticum]